ncbi:MAG: JAB domain-containing protein [Bacilli bacterium]
MNPRFANWEVTSYCIDQHACFEVFSTPLRERATAVIVAHNHPSKMLLPSMDDRNVTKRLREAGELLGIKVLDHLIFSDESYRSMLENNEWG